MLIGVWRRNVDRDILEELALYERIILKWNFKQDGEHVEWIYLAQDWVNWQAVLSTIN
jgi:hypothetical protein